MLQPKGPRYVRATISIDVVFDKNQTRAVDILPHIEHLLKPLIPNIVCNIIRVRTAHRDEARAWPRAQLPTNLSIETKWLDVTQFVNARGRKAIHQWCLTHGLSLKHLSLKTLAANGSRDEFQYMRDVGPITLEQIDHLLRSTGLRLKP